MLVAELVFEVVLDVALDVVLLELVAVIRGALLALACIVSVVSRPRIGCPPSRASRASSMKRQGVASEASQGIASEARQGVTSEAMGRGQQTRVSIRSI